MVGILIPVGLAGLFLVVTSRAKKDSGPAMENAAFHYNRLRTLGAKSTLKV